MKTIATLICVLLIAGCLASPTTVPDPKADSLITNVVAATVDLNLDATQEFEGSTLWDAFANKPYESQFSGISTRYWYSNWMKYKERLVEVARNNGLDSVGLRRCLNRIQPSPRSATALLPVGAFLTSKNSEPVWAIVCKWENSGNISTNQTEEYLGLGHVCVFALRAKDGKQVDFTTCL